MDDSGRRRPVFYQTHARSHASPGTACARVRIGSDAAFSRGLCSTAGLQRHSIRCEAIAAAALHLTRRDGAMAKKRARAQLLKARFPRLRQLRQEQLGWEIVDILSRLPGAKPSISSIYRLEQGDAIRMSSARRVFDVVNGALQNTLDVSKELEMSW